MTLADFAQQKTSGKMRPRLCGGDPVRIEEEARGNRAGLRGDAARGCRKYINKYINIFFLASPRPRPR